MEGQDADFASSAQRRRRLNCMNTLQADCRRHSEEAEARKPLRLQAQPLLDPVKGRESSDPLIFNLANLHEEDEGLGQRPRHAHRVGTTLLATPPLHGLPVRWFGPLDEGHRRRWSLAVPNQDMEVIVIDDDDNNAGKDTGAGSLLRGMENTAAAPHLQGQVAHTVTDIAWQAAQAALNSGGRMRARALRRAVARTAMHFEAGGSDVHSAGVDGVDGVMAGQRPNTGGTSSAGRASATAAGKSLEPFRAADTVSVGVQDTEQAASAAEDQSGVAAMIDKAEGTQGVALAIGVAAAGGSSGAGPSSKQLKCGICLDEQPASAFHTIDACQHQYCRGCLSRHVQLAAREKVFPVRCPQPECTGPGVSVVEGLQLLDIVEDREKLQMLEVESSLPQHLRFYCPNPACSLLMTLDEGEAPEDAPVRCPGCRKQLCARCRVMWHAGLSCLQQRTLQNRPGAADNDDAALLDVAGERGWKPCPQCRNMVELAHGCNHITCKCGSEWCYKCGALWRRVEPGGGGPLAGFLRGRSMPTCSCRLWDDNNRRLEQEFHARFYARLGVPADVAGRRAMAELVDLGLLQHRHAMLMFQNQQQLNERNQAEQNQDVPGRNPAVGAAGGGGGVLGGAGDFRAAIRGMMRLAMGLERPNMDAPAPAAGSNGEGDRRENDASEAAGAGGDAGGDANGDASATAITTRAQATAAAVAVDDTADSAQQRQSFHQRRNPEQPPRGLGLGLGLMGPEGVRMQPGGPFRRTPLNQFHLGLRQEARAAVSASRMLRGPFDDEVAEPAAGDAGTRPGGTAAVQERHSGVTAAAVQERHSGGTAAMAAMEVGTAVASAVEERDEEQPLVRLCDFHCIPPMEVNGGMRSTVRTTRKEVPNLGLVGRRLRLEAAPLVGTLEAVEGGEGGGSASSAVAATGACGRRKQLNHETVWNDANYERRLQRLAAVAQIEGAGMGTAAKAGRMPLPFARMDEEDEPLPRSSRDLCRQRPCPANVEVQRCELHPVCPSAGRQGGGATHDTAQDGGGTARDDTDPPVNGWQPPLFTTAEGGEGDGHAVAGGGTSWTPDATHAWTLPNRNLERRAPVAGCAAVGDNILKGRNGGIHSSDESDDRRFGLVAAGPRSLGRVRSQGALKRGLHLKLAALNMLHETRLRASLRGVDNSTSGMCSLVWGGGNATDSRQIRVPGNAAAQCKVQSTVALLHGERYGDIGRMDGQATDVTSTASDGARDRTTSGGKGGGGSVSSDEGMAGRRQNLAYGWPTDAPIRTGECTADETERGASPHAREPLPDVNLKNLGLDSPRVDDTNEPTTRVVRSPLRRLSSSNSSKLYLSTSNTDSSSSDDGNGALPGGVLARMAPRAPLEIGPAVAPAVRAVTAQAGKATDASGSAALASAHPAIVLRPVQYSGGGDSALPDAAAQTPHPFLRNASGDKRHEEPLVRRRMIPTNHSWRWRSDERSGGPLVEHKCGLAVDPAGMKGAYAAATAPPPPPPPPPKSNRLLQLLSRVSGPMGGNARAPGDMGTDGRMMVAVRNLEAAMARLEDTSTHWERVRSASRITAEAAATAAAENMRRKERELLHGRGVPGTEGAATGGSAATRSIAGSGSLFRTVFSAADSDLLQQQQELGGTTLMTAPAGSRPCLWRPYAKAKMSEAKGAAEEAVKEPQVVAAGVDAADVDTGGELQLEIAAAHARRKAFAIWRPLQSWQQKRDRSPDRGGDQGGDDDMRPAKYPTVHAAAATTPQRRIEVKNQELVAAPDFAGESHRPYVEHATPARVPGAWVANEDNLRMGQRNMHRARFPATGHTMVFRQGVAARATGRDGVLAWVAGAGAAASQDNVDDDDDEVSPRPLRRQRLAGAICNDSPHQHQQEQHQQEQHQQIQQHHQQPRLSSPGNDAGAPRHRFADVCRAAMLHLPVGLHAAKTPADTALPVSEPALSLVQDTIGAGVGEPPVITAADGAASGNLTAPAADQIGGAAPRACFNARWGLVSKKRSVDFLYDDRSSNVTASATALQWPCRMLPPARTASASCAQNGTIGNGEASASTDGPAQEEPPREASAATRDVVSGDPQIMTPRGGSDEVGVAAAAGPSTSLAGVSAVGLHQGSAARGTPCAAAPNTIVKTRYTVSDIARLYSLWRESSMSGGSGAVDDRDANVAGAVHGCGDVVLDVVDRSDVDMDSMATGEPVLNQRQSLTHSRRRRPRPSTGNGDIGGEDDRRPDAVDAPRCYHAMKDVWTTVLGETRSTKAVAPFRPPEEPCSSGSGGEMPPMPSSVAAAAEATVMSPLLLSLQARMQPPVATLAIMAGKSNGPKPAAAAAATEVVVMVTPARPRVEGEPGDLATPAHVLPVGGVQVLPSDILQVPTDGNGGRDIAVATAAVAAAKAVATAAVNAAGGGAQLELLPPPPPPVVVQVVLQVIHQGNGPLSQETMQQVQQQIDGLLAGVRQQHQKQ